MLWVDRSDGVNSFSPLKERDDQAEQDQTRISRTGSSALFMGWFLSLFIYCPFQEILATSNHPFIVTLYHSFQSDEYLYFCMGKSL